MLPKRTRVLIVIRIIIFLDHYSFLQAGVVQAFTYTGYREKSFLNKFKKSHTSYVYQTDKIY